MSTLPVLATSSWQLVVCRALDIYVIVLVISALLSWFPSRSGVLGEVKDILRRLTEPLMAPIRRAFPFLHTGSIDFSLLAVIVVIRIVQQRVLCR